MTKYQELLRDPRWQKKRLEILSRDEFARQKCFDSESTLHVHHRFYRKDAAPWEYPNNSLVTLCAECHQAETLSLSAEKKLLLDELSMKGLMAADFNDLAVSIHESDSFPPPLDGFIAAFGWALGDERMRQLIIREYELHLKERLNRHLQKGGAANG